MLTAFFVFLLGASVASFLFVWAERRSFRAAGTGRSVCNNCTLTLHGRDLVPVFSFLFLRGRCRRCKRCLPWMYLLFEVILGLALVAILWNAANGSWMNLLTLPRQEALLLARDIFFTLVFALLFAFDLCTQTLPDRITIPAIVIAAIWNIALGVSFPPMVWGALVCGGFFALQYLVSRGTWIGSGDIRYGFLLGILLGFSGGVLALFLAYVIGASVAIILLLSGLATRKSALPMGVFLSIAGFLVLVWGDVFVRYFL